MDNKNLFRMRIQKGVSVEELSKMIDVPVDTIRAWENGTAEPTANEYEKLSIFYNVGVDFLQGDNLAPQQVATSSQPLTQSGVALNHTSGQANVATQQQETKSIFKKDYPILSRWSYLAIPIASVLIFILMALVCYKFVIEIGMVRVVEKYSIYDVILAKNGQFAVGFCTLFFGCLFDAYLLIVMFFNRRLLTKLNIANMIVLGCNGLTNLILAAYTMAKLKFDGLQFVGWLVYILWLLLAVYSIVLAFLALYRFNKEEVDPREKAEKTREKAEKIKADKIAQKKERLGEEEVSKRIDQARKVKPRSSLYIIPVVLTLINYVATFFIKDISAHDEGTKTFWQELKWDGSLSMALYIAAGVCVLIGFVAVLVTSKKTKTTIIVATIQDFINLGLCCFVWIINYSAYRPSAYWLVYLMIAAMVFYFVKFIINIVKLVKLCKASGLDK